MKNYLFVFMLLFLSGYSFGQGEAAVPFLGFQQSPLFIGAGQIGTAIPSNDAIGFYFNPAQLGYFSIENNFAVSFLPNKTYWFNSRSPNLSYNNYSFAAGYNFGKDNGSLPLSVGIGYIHNRFDFGRYSATYSGNPGSVGTFESYDSFDGISIGASYKYYLIFNLGISAKFFNSVLGYIQPPEPGFGNGSANGTAFDFGAMVITPVSELLFKDAGVKFGKDLLFKPVFNFTLGYSFTNLGKEIYYIDPAQSDPIPRTTRLGYSFDFGVKLSVGRNTIKAINYSFTAEAEDLLIKNLNNGNVEYKGMLGDIKFGDNLIDLKGDNNVVVHKGHIAGFFETFILISGRYYGAGYQNIKTGGYGLSTEGIEKLLSMTINDPVINYISDHFVVEFYNTNCFEKTSIATNFKGLSVYYKDFFF